MPVRHRSPEPTRSLRGRQPSVGSDYTTSWFRGRCDDRRDHALAEKSSFNSLRSSGTACRRPQTRFLSLILSAKNSIDGLMSSTAKARSEFPPKRYWGDCTLDVRESRSPSAGRGRRYRGRFPLVRNPTPWLWQRISRGAPSYSDPGCGESSTCVATGDTVEEIEAQIREAIDFHLEGLREDGDPIPPPSSPVEYVDVAA